MKIEQAKRVKQIPPYIFAEIDRKKQELREKGMDLIDLGIGDPDIPTPKRIIDRLMDAAQDAENHRYPSYVGMLDFRQAVADWYKKRFQVSLDPTRRSSPSLAPRRESRIFPWLLWIRGITFWFPIRVIPSIGCQRSSQGVPLILCPW